MVSKGEHLSVFSPNCIPVYPFILDKRTLCFSTFIFIFPVGLSMLSNCTDLNFAYVHICVPMKVLYDIIYINYQLMQTLKRINSNNFTYLFIIGYSFILFLLIMRIKRSHIMCRTIKLLKINFIKLFLYLHRYTSKYLPHTRML